ncbi:hypothetical protein GCM10011391_12040 [Pullulanibacillus camelliae]|uniref:VOC domain-containing protein n=1 Tax=Pullulanibacillus camelliae TaxID=1707096 RepID=A0A8J2YFV0_9BACL|nr:hypothetical protein [Pullulanibacillus camelliae]GGE34960.1 hypothetical protein GCM10011391_12040 [Pullulanibacillus camelliae]
MGIKDNDHLSRIYLRKYAIIHHSVIDFYTSDLKGFYAYLKEYNVEVGSYNVNPDDPAGYGGLGFRDLDGNDLSACNINHDLL